MSDMVIEAKNAVLSYPRPHGVSLKGFFHSSSTSQRPDLGPFSISILSGSRVGVIGSNGAGKTSFLRVLSGIYPPSSGSVDILSPASAVIDSGLGFDPFATAMANIRMRCCLDGLTSSHEIQSVVDDVEEFVDLGSKFYEPIYTYSTGMFFRLAFAYATRETKSIAIIDELIGSGDLSFAKKAEVRLDKFLNESATLIMSSHSMDLIRKYCTSCIYIKSGEVTYFESINEAISVYENDSKPQ